MLTDLTAKEFDLIELSDAQPQPGSISREALLDAIWGYGRLPQRYPHRGTSISAVCGKSWSATQREPAHILTKWGVGLLFQTLKKRRFRLSFNFPICGSRAAYILLTSLVLVFLNNYASDMTRQLLYRSKETSLLDKVQLITSSFSGVEMLTSDNTAQVISVLGDLNVNRVLITDGAGVILYDFRRRRRVPRIRPWGSMPCLRPVAEALDGNNVFYCRYASGLLMSYAAAPVYLYGSPNGCVYLSDLGLRPGRHHPGPGAEFWPGSPGAWAAGMVIFSLVFRGDYIRKDAPDSHLHGAGPGGRVQS